MKQSNWQEIRRNLKVRFGCELRRLICLVSRLRTVSDEEWQRMYMRLVVCAKQQKPMARLPGPLLRLVARVVNTSLFTQSSNPFLPDKTTYRSIQCLTSYRLCSRGVLVITHLETPLVLLAVCPVTKSCRLHGIRLRHATVGPITQCLLDNREG